MSAAMQGSGGAVECTKPSDALTTHTNPYVCIDCLSLSTNEGCRDYVVSCPMGTFFDASTVECKQCEAGKYQTSARIRHMGDLGDITSCTTCEAGKYTLPQNSGATTCIMCEAGKYSTALGRVSECDGCAKGSYSNIDGATACTQCGPGSYSGNEAAVGNDHCDQTIKGTYVSGYGATAASVAVSGIYGLSVGYLWAVYRVSVGYLWAICGLSVGCL